MKSTVIERVVVPGVAATVGALLLIGCENLLEVDNPNRILDDDLRDPAAAPALANGALSRLSEAYGFIQRAQAPVSDEFTWIGSWDATRELYQGFPGNPQNEDIDIAFNNAGSARWMVDEAITRIGGFHEAGTLGDVRTLIRTLVYGGAMHTLIGDAFEEFAYSDRTESGPPIASEQMGQVYDRAVGYLDRAVALSREHGQPEWERTALALRARTQFGRAVKEKLTPAGAIPTDPLVNSAAAVADARAFLATGASPDWQFNLNFSGQTITNPFGFWANNRLEVRVADMYVVPDAEGRRVASIRMHDPIDDIPDPALAHNVIPFAEGGLYSSMTLASWREMHLILAEAELAAGNEAQAWEHINAVRAVHDLTPFTGQIPTLDMLQHSRRVNLFLQARRLADQYRFGVRSPEWLDGSHAVQRPGTFFPIAETERLSNCHIAGGC